MTPLFSTPARGASSVSGRRRASAWPALALPFLLLAQACAPGPETAAPPAPPPEAPAAAATPAAVASEAITEEGIRAHIHFLASDDMRGRDTPSPELERAADYLSSQLRELDLEPLGDDGGYLQRWPYTRFALDHGESLAAATVDGSRSELRYAHDYFAIPGAPALASGTPVFAASPAAAAQGLPAEASGVPLLVALPDGLGPDFPLAIQTGMQAGASGVVLIMDDETEVSEIFQIAGALEGGAAGMMPIPVLGLRYAVGARLLAGAGLDLAMGPETQVLDGVTLEFRSVFRQETHEVPNVVAMLRGSDPSLANEHVILTAHFDHVGVGPADERGDSIFSGADDNASGTAAIIEVARAFSRLPEAPARSVIFLLVSGEEKGLLGSAHFAANPTVPGEGMIANLNLDMVSRNAPDTVYAIGEEYSDLGPWVQAVARLHPELGLHIAPDPEPEEQAFLRSDHFSFVERGIPSLMLTTWLHDGYHLPSDTPDRADAEKAARVARLAFLLAHRIADNPERPQWNAAGEELLRELQGTGPP